GSDGAGRGLDHILGGAVSGDKLALREAGTGGDVGGGAVLHERAGDEVGRGGSRGRVAGVHAARAGGGGSVTHSPRKPGVFLDEEPAVRLTDREGGCYRVGPTLDGRSIEEGKGLVVAGIVGIGRPCVRVALAVGNGGGHRIAGRGVPTHCHDNHVAGD